MKKNILLFLLPFIFFCNKGNAQVIGISPYSVVIGNDTLPAGATDSISFWVVNSGSVVFNDSMRIYTYVQDSASTSTYYPVDTAYIPFTTIAPSDSIQIFLLPTYDVGPLKYHYDINVIVIWPSAYTAGTGDSLIYNEMIILPAGITEIDLHDLINAYPNPSIQDICIRNDSKKRIEEVRIWDTGGRWIASIKEQTTINIESWKPGTYLLTIVLEDQNTITIRVVKQ